MKLLIFGYGYTARHLAAALGREADIVATTRDPAKAAAMAQTAITARVFPGADMTPDLDWATHVLVTAGPQDGRDPVLASLHDALAGRAGKLAWLGYLSTTGVYGDHGGGWVTEETPLGSDTERGRARIVAEGEWRALHAAHRLPLHVFRLTGIYGPGRGPFAKLRAGTARRIVKEGQVFGRIHVDDIVQTLVASMRAPDPGAAYNVSDDDPAPPQDVIAHAAELLGLPVPPAIPFEEAEKTMSPMARSFYAESKRVDNTRIKRDLGVRLRFPGYRDGLSSILAQEVGDGGAGSR